MKYSTNAFSGVHKVYVEYKMWFGFCQSKHYYYPQNKALFVRKTKHFLFSREYKYKYGIFQFSDKSKYHMLANSPPFDRQRQYPPAGRPSVLLLFPLALYRIYDGGSIYMLNGTGISVNKCVYLNIGDRKRITHYAKFGKPKAYLLVYRFCA